VDPIPMIFDRMDTWRHLPHYQLERRADILFSLYIHEALESKLGFPVLDTLIPEFPVRIGTICPGITGDKSYKIDYLALSTSRTQPVFVELKTEGLSRRTAQDEYLRASQRVGLPRLLEGLLDIFRATKAKRKCFALLLHLQRIGLVEIPNALIAIMSRSSLRGASEASQRVRILADGMESPRIVYIQPRGDHPQEEISFHEFAAVVQRHSDPVAQRFAQSLHEWASVQTGDYSLMQHIQRTAL